ncbi:hypothetical protein WH367_03565 [Comamonas sp. MYb21]|uniref:hypothetical protein n=1 Tax=Comamonas sp. MYb21 TaxID=1848648 RepID=UPI0030A26127
MTFMRQTFMAVRYLALLLFVLGAGVLTALLVANWHDDPLSETARQVLQMPPTDAMQEGNGYLIIVGLNAPTDSGNPISSAETFARQSLAKSQEARHQAKEAPQSFDAIMAWATSTGEDGVSPLTLDCSWKADKDCFSWTLANRNQVLTLVQTYRPLLVRYEAAATAPQFINLPYDIFNPLPSYSQLRSVHALMLAKATLEWPLSAQVALDTMEITSRLRARMGNTASSLLEAMVVLEMQSAELRWLSQAMRHTNAHISPIVSSRIRELILQPGPNLDSALQGEQQLIVGMLPLVSQKGQYDSWQEKLHDNLSRLGVLPIATLNASLEHLDQIKAMAHLPANALEAAFKTYHRVSADRYHCARPLRLRNYFGTCMVAMNSDHYQSSFQRVHDLDGYRRLVMLQYLAMHKSIPAQDMQAWVQASPTELHNPYTLQAMQWLAATHSLIFEGKEPHRSNPGGSATYRIPLRQKVP